MVACAVRPSRRLSKTSTGSAAKRRHLQLCHARFIELSCTSPDVNCRSLPEHLLLLRILPAAIAPAH
jgi:hypothetical protein